MYPIISSDVSMQAPTISPPLLLEKNNNEKLNGRVDVSRFGLRCPHCIFTHHASEDCKYVQLFKKLSGMPTPFLLESNSFISNLWRSISWRIEDNSDVIKARRDLVHVIKLSLQAVYNNESEKELFRKDYVTKIEEFYAKLNPKVMEVAKQIAKEHNFDLSQDSISKASEKSKRGRKSKVIHDKSSENESDNESESSTSSDDSDSDYDDESSHSFSNSTKRKAPKKLTRSAVSSNPHLAGEIVGPLKKQRKKRKKEATPSNSTISKEKTNKENKESKHRKGVRKLDVSEIRQVDEEQNAITPLSIDPRNTIKPVIESSITFESEAVQNANTSYFTPSTTLPLPSRTYRDYEEIFLSTSTPTIEQLYNSTRIATGSMHQSVDRRVVVYATFQDETVVISNTLQESNFSTIISKIHAKFPQLPHYQFCTFHYFDDLIFKLVRFDTDALSHIINTQTFPIIKITIKV